MIKAITAGSVSQRAPFQRSNIQTFKRLDYDHDYDYDDDYELRVRITSTNHQRSTINNQLFPNLRTFQRSNLQTFKPSNGSITITITNYDYDDDYEHEIRYPKSDVRCPSVGNEPLASSLEPRVRLRLRITITMTITSTRSDIRSPMSDSPRRHGGHEGFHLSLIIWQFSLGVSDYWLLVIA